MKNSGLADSPFFEVTKKEIAPPSQARVPAQRGAKRTTGQEAVLTSERNAEKAGDQEHSLPIGQADGATARRHDGTTAAYADILIETLRRSVKEVGKERSEHRLTVTEKETMVELVYQLKRQGFRTTENEISRIAVNFLLADHRQHGERSLLARVIYALNA